MKIFQKGFNFSQDGPGNRLVFHVAGCNMYCPWCSNPEGMKVQSGYVEYTAEMLLTEAQNCRMMFFGGGGVTFTGGEATLEYKELLAALSAMKQGGINTAIETNGTSPHLEELLPYIDYLIMDFKHYNDETLKAYTGIGTEQIMRNYEIISRLGRQCHIRIPLINGFNADCPKGFAEYLSSFETSNIVFEFLKYHEYGKEKWKEEYKIANGFVTDETVKQFKETFCTHGLKCIKT